MNIFEMLEALDKARADARDAWDALWSATKNSVPPEDLATLQEVYRLKMKVSMELSDRVMDYIKSIEWLRRNNND